MKALIKEGIDLKEMLMIKEQPKDLTKKETMLQRYKILIWNNSLLKRSSEKAYNRSKSTSKDSQGKDSNALIEIIYH
jgi:hypothetical protein